MTSHLSLVHSIDQLYESVVMDPEAWNDQALSDWAADVAGSLTDRDLAKHIRRTLRIAVKLREFWQERPRSGETDWRSMVDVAIGPPAWRPTLAIAQGGLAVAPSEELFDTVKQRFREVNSEWWMDGVTYAEWLSEQQLPQRG